MSKCQLNQERLASLCRDGFCVIDPCLAQDTLAAFRAECEALSRGVDLEETDCVVDLWAPQALDDGHPARIDKEVYSQLRSRIVSRAMKSPMQASIGANGASASNDIVSRTVLGGLASLANQAFEAMVHTDLARGCDSKADVSGMGEERMGAEFAGSSPDTRLFNEHYVVKPANSSIEFGWHTDQNEQLQMCLQRPLVPYLSLWIPLCDTGEDNGTLEILPRRAPQPPEHADKTHPFFLTLDSEVKATHEAMTHECASGRAQVCTDPAARCLAGGLPVPALPGPAPASADMDASSTTSSSDVPVCKCIRVRAGGAVLFASDVWHRSGANRGCNPRPVFYAQYSCGMLRSDGSLDRPNKSKLAAPNWASTHRQLHQEADAGDSTPTGQQGSNGSSSRIGNHNTKLDTKVSDGVCSNSSAGDSHKRRRLTAVGPLAFAVPTEVEDAHVGLAS